MSKTFEALQKAERDQTKSIPANVFSSGGASSKNRSSDKQKVITWVTEEYRRLRQYIVSSYGSDKIKSVLFTSAKAKEGTSTVVLNFALDIARNGEKVILVDANLRTPAIHSFLGLNRENGFTDLLYGKSKLENVIKRTDVENLEVITSGAPLDNPVIGLSSKLLPSIIVEMKARASWILFDSSPIHDYNDSRNLAEKLDGVIMVVQAEKTKWEVAQTAKEKISGKNIVLLGAILNKKQMYIPNWLYKII